MLPLLLALSASLFSLKATPTVSFAPSTITITVRVAPNAEARELLVAMDGGDYARSSILPLDGERAPITHRVEWRDVPAGEYEIVAKLLGTSKVLNSATTQITVEGRF